MEECNEYNEIQQLIIDIAAINRGKCHKKEILNSVMIIHQIIFFNVNNGKFFTKNGEICDARKKITIKNCIYPNFETLTINILKSNVDI